MTTNLGAFAAATAAAAVVMAITAPPAGHAAPRSMHGSARERGAAHETFKGHVVRRSCNKVDYRAGDEVIWMHVKIDHLKKGAFYAVGAVHNPQSQTSSYRWLYQFTAQHHSLHGTIKISGLGLRKSARPPLHKKVPVVLQLSRGETVVASHHGVVPRCHGTSDK
jgi:hypothetical protein